MRETLLDTRPLHLRHRRGTRAAFDGILHDTGINMERFSVGLCATRTDALAIFNNRAARSRR